GHCAGGSGLICGLGLSAPRAFGMASAAPDQYGGNVSACEECPLSSVAGVRAAAQHAVGGRGHGLSGPPPSSQLYAAGAVGGGLSRSVALAHRFGARCGGGGLVRVPQLDV